MKNKYLLFTIIISILLLLIFISFKLLYQKENNLKELNGSIIGFKKDSLLIEDQNNIIYEFKGCPLENNNWEEVAIKYTGLLDNYQAISYDCDFKKMNKNIDIPKLYDDNGLFSQYYKLAYDKLQSLSLDEKIGQVLLARYANNTDLDKYKLAGFIFYEKDFQDKTKDEVKQMISSLQKKSSIPLLTAVDEEGGKVIRVSSNPKLVSTPFPSSSSLYEKGGLEAIKEDTINKSKILNELGLNLNLAPVVDVSLDEDDYIYERSLKQNTSIVANYAQTVITNSKNSGVSYVLKHFPGYGNAKDTHYGGAVNNMSYEDIQKIALPPFTSGIKAEAEAVLVNHVITNSIDEDNPSSLSINVHNLLRDDLNFTGVIISDDLGMGAISSIENVEAKALLAGNDLLIVTDYEESFNNIKKALNDNMISQNLIDKCAFKILAWKYYKGLMFLDK